MGGSTRRTPWLVVAAYAVTAAAGGALEVHAGSGLSSSESSTLGRSAVSLAMLGVASCAALILSHRRRAPAGVLLMAIAFAWAAISVLTGIAGSGPSRGANTVARTAAWLAAPGALVAAFLVARLLVAFPDGLPARGLRRLAGRLLLTGLVVGAVGLMTSPGTLAGGVAIRNPHAVPDALRPAAQAAAVGGFLLVFGCGLGALVGLQVRRRRASGDLRSQLALVSAPASTLLLGFLVLVFGPNSGSDVAGAAIVLCSVLGLAAATAVALLRYRLYAIDIVLERAAVFIGLAVVATAVYIGAVAAVSTIAGHRASSVAAVIASVAAASTLLAVQRRLVRLARRIVYGDRATPYEALSTFAAQVSGAVSLDRVLPATAAAAGVGLGASSVVVEVDLPYGGTRAACWPEDASAPSRPVAEPVEMPVEHEGATVGRISVVLPRGDRLDVTRQRLLADLGRQAGLALHNVQLAAELEDAVAELQASRLRIVQAQDAERRRVERDLHDGAQQRLVQLALTLRLATDAVGDRVDDATQLLTRAAADLADARQELRELARGIHPAVLTEAGLAAAIESLAERATVPVSVDVPAGRLPSAVEAAAYFVVAEALTNVGKHAAASSAQVTARVADGLLVLAVTDDGCGGADSTIGTGLQGLRDRVGAVDGRLRIASPIGGGTRIMAEFPCA